MAGPGGKAFLVLGRAPEAEDGEDASVKDEGAVLAVGRDDNAAHNCNAKDELNVSSMPQPRADNSAILPRSQSVFSSSIQAGDA